MSRSKTLEALPCNRKWNPTYMHTLSSFKSLFHLCDIHRIPYGQYRYTSIFSIDQLLNRIIKNTVSRRETLKEISCFITHKTSITITLNLHLSQLSKSNLNFSTKEKQQLKSLQRSHNSHIHTHIKTHKNMELINWNYNQTLEVWN